MSIDGEVLIWIGRLFHSRGAATLKRLSAVTVPDLRSCNRCASLERRDLEGVYGWIRADKYGGWLSWQAFQHSVATLKSTRRRTGSQCRLRRRASECVLLLLLLLFFRVINSVLTIFYAISRLCVDPVDNTSSLSLEDEVECPNVTIPQLSTQVTTTTTTARPTGEPGNTGAIGATVLDTLLISN